MNPFEAGRRKCIPATLIYPRFEDEFLMLHKNIKPGGRHHGKHNGLGGKLEADESALDCACREFYEETTWPLPVQSFHPLGMLHFPNFKPQKSEDWLVTVFWADLPGRPGLDELSSPEGELVWAHKDQLLDLNLWAGDGLFLPYVIAKQPFQGTIWYAGEAVVREQIQVLSVPPD